MVHKILVIDDSATQLGVLKLQFSKSGFEVETATSGSEGYQKVFTFAPDIVLSDVIMPNLNGYQLCRLLKNNSLSAEIPVLLLTVLDKKIDEFWSDKSGANGFLSKTSDFNEILSTVNAEILANPVSQEYKNALQEQSQSDVSAQSQINTILDDLLLDTTLLNEFRKLNEFIPQEKVLIDKIFELLGSFLDFNVAGIFFNTPNERKVLHLVTRPLAENVLDDITKKFFTGSGFDLDKTEHHLVGKTKENEDEISSLEELGISVSLPLYDGEKLLGGICFYNLANTDRVKFYKIMIEEFVILFRTKSFHDITEFLSITDGLTGLYNRRHFDYNLEREFSRTKRYPCDLSLAIIDIDHFKSINDKYGHQFGDYALKEIAKILHNSFRKTDMIYRYGGEELAIILTETSTQNATIPLERLKDAIAAHQFTYGDNQTSITVSIGLSANLEGIESEKSLLESADKALYVAKQTGRNKLVSASNE